MSSHQPSPSSSNKRPRANSTSTINHNQQSTSSQSAHHSPASTSRSKRVWKATLSTPQSPSSSSNRPWPPFFKDLERVYRALNTVFTFCSTRKHLHTTIENMRSSVEGLLKTQLKIDSIAQIKTLLPDLIRFTYVDKDTLAALHEVSVTTRKKKDNLNIYDPNLSRPDLAMSEVEEVLLFQFLDGQLKTSQRHAKKLPRQHALLSSSTKIVKDDIMPRDLLTPSYSPKVMLKMVEKRNIKFSEAVEELLDACAAHDPPVDPTELLIECASENVPIKLESRSRSSSIDRSKPQSTSNLDTCTAIPTIRCVLNELKSSSQYRGQIVQNGECITPSRQASFKNLQLAKLSSKLHQTLKSTKGIAQLYSHQAKAIDLLSTGSSLIVTTSTSSGKSLIYQIPMLQALETNQNTCGLYIFPTKALAQDQKQSLNQLVLNYGEPLSATTCIETYDGDTALDDRAIIRSKANVIFTNPDMLHSSILPNEEIWRRFFQNLKYVVVDELHVYAGLFGSHVAMIMRRLRRVCEAVGNSTIQFISCSATIKNPIEHMKKMFSLDQVELISEDGAPSGNKHQIVWNPPLIDDREPGQGRTSAMIEASQIFRFLIKQNIRTIVFCKTRKACELLFKQIQDDLSEIQRKDLISRVRSYRSGYTTKERRLIESEMFNGQCIGIIATTALELGIDIGGLDAVITLGFPHSLSGLVQQSGRAGRRNKESLAMLILEQRGLDQHFAHHPEELFNSQGSSISLEDLENVHLLVPHLHCSAHEIPILPSQDTKFFGDRLSLLCQENLMLDPHGFYHSNETNPSSLVSIRGILSNPFNTTDLTQEQQVYTIIDLTDNDRPKILEEIQFDRVLFECFEGSVYLNQGRSFQVLELDHHLKTVHVRLVYVNYFTKPLMFVNLIPFKTLAQLPIISDCLSEHSHFIFLGKIKITTNVTGYLKVDNKNHKKILDQIDLPYESSESSSSSNKTHQYDNGSPNNYLSSLTHGVWVDVPFKLIESLVSILKKSDDEGSGVEHQLKGSSPKQGQKQERFNVDEQNIGSSNPRVCYERVNLIVHLIEHLIVSFNFSSVEKNTSQTIQSDRSTIDSLFKSPLENGHKHLAISCNLVNKLSFLNSTNSRQVQGNQKLRPRHYSLESSHQNFKLVERILIYEDPKKKMIDSNKSSYYDELKDLHLLTKDNNFMENNIEDKILKITPLINLFRNFKVILLKILDFLDNCPCLNGCSSCIFKPVCQNLSIVQDENELMAEKFRGFKFCILVFINDLLNQVWVPE